MSRGAFPLLFLVCLAWTWAFPATAQLPAGSLLEGSFHQGKILKHTPKIAYQIPDQSTGGLFCLSMPVRQGGQLRGGGGRTYWGGGFQYYTLGDANVLGYGIGVFPHLTFRLSEKPKWRWQVRVGSGLALLSRSYDRISNPSNNAIGSALNNLTFFQTNILWKVSSDWAIGGGGSFTHYSNGAAQMPNLGVNVPAWSLAVHYQPRGELPFLKEGGPEAKAPLRRLGAQLQFNMAFKESAGPGGPKLPVYFGGLAAVYRLSETNTLVGGFEFEYQESIYQFALHTYTLQSPEAARAAASRWMLFGAYEPRFGQVSLLLQAGTYVGSRSLLVPFRVYNKLGVRYHFPEVGRLPARLFVGVYLKSHQITAEYIGLGAGATLW